MYISSDANVMELVMGPANNDRAHWYLPILRSRTVIMHGTQSRFNNDIEAVRTGKLPWYELKQGGRSEQPLDAELEIGRAHV